MPERNVTILPKIDRPKRVAIDCRVSSASREQIHSLIVQAEKLRRSNIVKDATGTHRSSKKYSAKK